LDFLPRQDDLALPGFAHSHIGDRFQIGNGIAGFRTECRKPPGCRSGEKAWD
jgi:hypothetical protein